MFQGPKRQRNHLEIYGRQYLEGRRPVGEGSEQAEARGPGWGTPRGQGIWPRGPTPFGLLVSVSSIPLRLRFVPSKKNDPRKVSGHLDVVWVPETSKYRKRGFLTVQG